MTAWPRLERPPSRRPLRYSNVAYYRRVTGKDPLYTSAAYPGSVIGTQSPVWVDEPMTVRRLGIYNGTTLSGGNLASIGLVAGYNDIENGWAYPQGLICWTIPFARAGTSTWQWQAIEQGEARIGRGLYYLVYNQNDATSHVMRLSVENITGFDAFIGGQLLQVSFPVTTWAGWGNGSGNLDHPVLALDGVTPA